jgi:hypothetical protein
MASVKTMMMQGGMMAGGDMQCASVDMVSPLMLADRLLTLAQDADRAGFSGPAERLLKLAYVMCNEKPH